MRSFMFPSLPRPLSLLAVSSIMIAGLVMSSCGGGTSGSGASSSSADSGSAVRSVPGPETLASAPPVIAISTFDREQGSAVTGAWKRLSGSIAALQGFLATRLFVTMDWQSEQQVVVLGMWQTPDDARRAMPVASSTVPARGWSNTAVYRLWAQHGEMRDSVFRSIVLIIPIPAGVDSAKSVQSYQTVSEFARQQPGYIASILAGRVEGDPSTSAVVLARWATREHAHRMHGNEEFKRLIASIGTFGPATSYLEIIQ